LEVHDIGFERRKLMMEIGRILSHSESATWGKSCSTAVHDQNTDMLFLSDQEALLAPLVCSGIEDGREALIVWHTKHHLLLG
jgi:hypothetical protein